MMRVIYLLIFGVSLVFTSSCNRKRVFSHFVPLNHYEQLSNITKLGTGYMLKDSSIVFPCLMDTFEVHFDIDAQKNNALIFSVDRIDTIGNLKMRNKCVWLIPKDGTAAFKLFDFNQKKNDSLIVGRCGPLSWTVLKVKDVKRNGYAILQKIIVSDAPWDNDSIPPPPPPPADACITSIRDFTVSSETGITEMDIYVGWSKQEIKVKNAQ